MAGEAEAGGMAIPGVGSSLAENPGGYDCHTATGVACPIGLGVQA
jgi:hypothetical protein